MLYSRQEGSLFEANTMPISGQDVIGVYQGVETSWLPADTYFHTSYRTYQRPSDGTVDVVVFKQDFRNRDQVRG